MCSAPPGMSRQCRARAPGGLPDAPIGSGTGGVRAPGGPPGLQNRWTALRVVGGFDSRPPPLPGQTSSRSSLVLTVVLLAPTLERGLWEQCGTVVHGSRSTSLATAPAAARCASMCEYPRTDAFASVRGYSHIEAHRAAAGAVASRVER